MKILKDRTSLEHFADQLVDIAEYYKFDGWLVNIENPIQVSHCLKVHGKITVLFIQGF